ncbi:hypothetical protein NQ318_009058 [Aromia moschata]|uniref:Uncharacterized protein n=1 Tax=Aromia moschata TaxID=1265417 RepID=A0AAV8YT31_9CUCU|nr:hypothetical protein NQ318_009058 [Aromia moschata]
MFEPRSHDGEVARGIAVGKALLRTEKNSTGYCSSVSSVIRRLDTEEKFSWEDYRRVIKPPVVFLKILEK